MSRQLRILGIASWYPSREHATLGNFVKRHAEAIASQHFIVMISAFESAYNSIEVIEGEEDKPNEVIVYYRKRIPFFSHDFAIRKARRVANDYFGNFDIAHLHVVYPSGIIALNLRIPYVVTEHFSGYHNPPGFRWGFIRKWLTKQVLKGASAVMPVSDHLGTAIERFSGNSNMYKVSNVVNTSLFHIPDTPFIGSFTFLHISTLEERSKNISGLLDAFAILENQDVDYQLKIGGDGDLNELRQMVDKRGLDWNKVELIEERPIAGIASLMAKSHCFVLFSNFENQPCVILEALCTGLPIVSTNVGGIPEEITPKNGLLIEPGDPIVLAAALREMMENYNNYQRDEIAREAQDLYSYEKVAQKISEVYLSVLNEDSSDR